MIQWSIEWLQLDLNYTWKISRNASTFKRNAIITVKSQSSTGIGEVAPNIRYQETPENIQEEFEQFILSGANQVGDLSELTLLLNQLNLHNALRFGIESAYIHLMCHAEKKSFSEMMHIPKVHAVSTSFSFPMMEIHELASFYQKHNLKRFSKLKVKVGKEQATQTIQEICSFSQKPLIIDANEAFNDADEVLKFFETIQPYNIAYIEQPLPDGMIDDYTYLKTRSPYEIIADESICADADFEQLKNQFHGINMKLMKAGGYLKGIELLDQARLKGMKTMIGCMIETTLGIASALHVSQNVDYIDLDGFMVIKNEPYNLVHEENGYLSLNM